MDIVYYNSGDPFYPRYLGLVGHIFSSPNKGLSMVINLEV